MSNSLIHESSPYLLQHAHNPVEWHPWNPEVLEKAKKENRLLVISIGYSSCHWCHVMEHESFEDVEVAEVMNANYINIKVDREERPDVDQVYMNAVQLMTGSGGWPLNVVTLPDGRPVWGGTYFRKEQWKDALLQIKKLHDTQPEKLKEYADKLEKGIKAMDVVALNTEGINFRDFDLTVVMNKWAQSFDWQNGGTLGAPKFMMPNNYHFLLRKAFHDKDENLMNFVDTTLTKMAYGGVFDHINGGFSRYSVDDKWHVPHFEKMLYDNAQLVSLYSDAYLVSKNPLYKETVYETLNFIKRELTSAEGLFYTALDADSINEYGILEEGAFYVFTKEELQEQLQDDFDLFAAYYNINDYGKWEERKYVLIRKKTDDEICNEFSISAETLQQKKHLWKETLQNHRSSRTRPRLDNKALTSWNAMMIKGCADAYRVFSETTFLETALRCADFILKNQLLEDGFLFRNYANGKPVIAGYLEDYAHLTDAFIGLYENTLDEKWLQTAKLLADYTFENFFDTESKMFFFTSKKEEQLISRTVEYRDNVMPASNSVHAKNLFRLAHYFAEPKYEEAAKQMLLNVLPEVKTYPSAYSNWLNLLLNFKMPFYEIAVLGQHAEEKIKEINAHYIPNKIISGSKKPYSSLPLLQNRYIKDKTVIYICSNKTCSLPVTEATEAVKLMHNQK